MPKSKSGRSSTARCSTLRPVGRLVYEQTALAGTTGNSIMSGHVDYWDVGPAVFRNVANLQPGAEIRVVGQDGATYVYALEYIERVYVAELTAEELNSPACRQHRLPCPDPDHLRWRVRLRVG